MMTVPDKHTKAEIINRRITQIAWGVIGLLVFYVIVMAVRWQPSKENQATQDADTAAIYEQINPKDGYDLAVSYGDLGPKLIASGVIDYDAFAAIYQNAGSPLATEQIKALKNGSDQEIVINSQNAYYLLNY
jgi:hypothetical protein